MNDMEDEESQEEDIRGKQKARAQTQVLGEIEVPHAGKER